MVVPILVCSSFLLGLPCFFTTRINLICVSGVTSIISILYWSDIIPRWIDICSSRVCFIYYLILNCHSKQFKKRGFIFVGIFSIFYILSCFTCVTLFHILFHFFATCAKFCVIMEPTRNPRTFGMRTHAMCGATDKST